MGRQVYHYNRRSTSTSSYRSSYKKQTKTKSRIRPALLAITILFVVGLLVFLPKDNDFGHAEAFVQSDNVSVFDNDLPRPIVNPKWPGGVQSAVGAVGYGVLASNNNQAKPRPMASLAKVMASILIIEKNQLKPGESGAEIEITKQDIEIYDKYLAKGGVVHDLKVGQKITQTDALKAMLISSSNNIADTAVIDSFGSVDEYLLQANQKAKDLGMESTVYADVTGFSPNSVSTASDLVILADYVMKNPLFAQIVGTWQTKVFKDKKITNTNSFLDYKGNGVVGIKTGLTDEAGGTYMASARYKVGDKNVVALAVVLGAKNHFLALEKAQPLLVQVGESFRNLDR